MEKSLKQISEHMFDYGINTLARAVYDVTFSEMTQPYCHAHAIPLAATAAEIIIKGRIAKEHPLLIFDRLPKAGIQRDRLSFADLLENGHTIEYQELPERLWAATGIRIKEQKRFLEFGKLRNAIIHFAVPDIDLQLEVYNYSLKIIDPMIHDFMKDSVLNHVSTWDDAILTDGYLEEALLRTNIELDEVQLKILKECKN